MNPKNQGHVKQGDQPDLVEGQDDFRDLEARNEARSAGLPGEEPRNVHKAGGGTVGASLGGAHTGRRGSHVGAVSNRGRKPRGGDKEAR